MASPQTPMPVISNIVSLAAPASTPPTPHLTGMHTICCYGCIIYMYVVGIRVFPSKMKMFQVVSFNSSNPPFGATFYNDYAHQISFDLNNIYDLRKKIR